MSSRHALMDRATHVLQCVLTRGC